ncbi:Beta-barrel assembly-enhancing protease [Pseudidiomarina piscicola]|uniref:Beta-barrel assembly-enhancing protease n=1 Tax=Pseudidiomarina piscicola TaxID=2614830 RepID=A0A6S6WPH7_9GAMM|nr:type IV pilus biogenesis/stability protein PilW [Pseudidiomarina piscicola]CAB0151139.1 Beta-barrel assembly-enhancing protease [Pseudidiomarina piscicola]VZT40646.1 Beta-barrel assembly-enhancing protease [Pseudomonas aeruginosa]
MRRLQQILLVTSVALLVTGCVSQRTVDGKNQPAQKFNTQEAASTRLALGLQYLQSGNYQQARANLERAREYTPNNPAVLTGLAFYYQRVKEYQSAERYYRQAIDLQPTNGDTYNNLGALLCSIGRYDEADRYFQQALQIPDYIKVASTYENAARCAAKAGKMQQSDQYFRRAMNHSAGSSSILESYAAVLLEQQRTEKAAQVLRQRANLPQLSAQYLWLEIQLAKQQNNKVRQISFAELLLSRFPNSRQAREYQAQTSEPNS